MDKAVASGTQPSQVPASSGERDVIGHPKSGSPGSVTLNAIELTGTTALLSCLPFCRQKPGKLKSVDQHWTLMVDYRQS